MLKTDLNRVHLLLCAAALLAALSCSDDDTGVTTDAGVSDGPVAGDGAADAAAPACKHTVWKKGTVAFKEVTTAWKLDKIEGVRITVVDIDGDGWADLVPRVGSKLFVLRNTGKGTFEDVTSKAKLYAPRSGTTQRKVDPVSFGDVDNDGDLDAYTGVQSTTGGLSELMINQGDGTFKHGDTSSPLRNTGAAENPAGGAFLDYDLDGKLDVWVPHNGTGYTTATIAYQDRLYRGDGKGGFSEVTTAAGMATKQWASLSDLNKGLCHSRAWGALACDLNDDGYPELMVPSYGRAPNHLWQASASGGKVTYANRSVASGYAFDDNKSWQDNQFARCYCKSNPTATGCAGVPAPQIVCSTTNWTHSQDREDFRLGGNSASTTCADLNNDGYMDLLTGEIKHWWAGAGSDGSEVLLNSGKQEISFTRPGDKALGLEISKGSASWDEGHMTQAVLDFDNDGLLDIYQGDSDYPTTRAHLYHQVKSTDASKPLLFEEVPMAEGIDHRRAHGVAIADFDRDGDADIVVGHSRARCGSTGECYSTYRVRLFENQIGNKNAWVQLHLVGDGVTANKAAIGAQAKVTACGMTQTQQVGGGHGHFGTQNDLVLHFGAGDAAKVQVKVRWPDAKLTTQTFTLDTRKRYKIEMGKQPVEASKK